MFSEGLRTEDTDDEDQATAEAEEEARVAEEAAFLSIINEVEEHEEDRVVTTEVVGEKGRTEHTTCLPIL